MPLLHKRVGQGTYNFLVEKLKKKLRAWKGHSMSMASRALLVQTTSSIANYAMKRLWSLNTLWISWKELMVASYEEMWKGLLSFIPLFGTIFTNQKIVLVWVWSLWKKWMWFLWRDRLSGFFHSAIVFGFKSWAPNIESFRNLSWEKFFDQLHTLGEACWRVLNISKVVWLRRWKMVHFWDFGWMISLERTSWKIYVMNLFPFDTLQPIISSYYAPNRDWDYSLLLPSFTCN